MEMRYLKRENENGQEERFYPITHAKAIVYGEDDKAILNNIKTHLNDKNNPHGLDAEDVGARPDTWMPTASDVGALSESVFDARFGGALGYAEDIEEFASACPIGASSFRTYSGTKGVPSDYSMWQYTNGLVFRRDADICVVVLFAILENKIAMKSFTNGVWTEWGIFGAGDFLPLTGGTLSGQHLFLNDGLGRVHCDGSGTQLDAFDNAKDLTNRRVLEVYSPKTRTTPQSVKLFTYENGHLTGNHNIFGEHNKPKGSYTGNGSATRRYVEVGGIGQAILIRKNSSDSFVIVTTEGALIKNGASVSAVSKDEAYWYEITGTLQLNSANVALNESGKTYYYQVL